MLNKEEMAELEDAVRSALVARKKELSMSDDSVGKMAFPFMANPLGKVQALLVGQGSGEKRKPQQMKLGDLLNLCESLGLPWRDVIKSAVEAVKKK